MVTSVRGLQCEMKQILKFLPLSKPTSMVVHMDVVQNPMILSRTFQILYESHAILGNAFFFSSFFLFFPSALDSCCTFCYPT